MTRFGGRALAAYVSMQGLGQLTSVHVTKLQLENQNGLDITKKRWTRVFFSTSCGFPPIWVSNSFKALLFPLCVVTLLRHQFILFFPFWFCPPVISICLEMKILCLHGNGTSGHLFALQTASIRRLLGEEFEYVVLDAPLESSCAAGKFT